MKTWLRVAHVWAKERSISAPPAYAGASGVFTAMGIATEDSSTRCDAVPQLTWRPRGVAHLPHSAGHQNSALIQMPPWTRGAEAAERAKAPVSRSGALNSMKEVQSSSQPSQPWLEWLGHCWSAGKCNSPPTHTHTRRSSMYFKRGLRLVLRESTWHETHLLPTASSLL